MNAETYQISYLTKIKSNFTTYAYCETNGRDKIYVFYPNIQLRLVSALIFFNCSIFTGIFTYLNDFQLNIGTVVFSVVFIFTSLILFFKSYAEVLIHKTQKTIIVKNILSQAKFSTDNLIAAHSILRVDIVYGLHWPKKTFYLRMSKDARIRLNIGLKPDHTITTELETLIHRLSEEFNIKFILN